MRLILAALISPVLATPSAAETVNVAVAANFTAVAEQLARDFEAATGHRAILSFGATGQLFTQMTQAAPFGVFLAADTERPEKAIAEGLAVPGSGFVYARGALSLYGPGRNMSDGKEALRGEFQKLAIADPEAAPYGAAALQALDAMGLRETVSPRLVEGENISQTLQFIQSGNAELGFVAASQIIGEKDQWLVPQDFYTPIDQEAVLLDVSKDNAAAVAFLDYLRTDAAVAVIVAAGYTVP